MEVNDNGDNSDLNFTTSLPWFLRNVFPNEIMSFTELPDDIILKILESLPGVDIARVSCLSSELRNLGSSDYLWEMKFVEQFGPGAILREGETWKEKFAESWIREVIN